MTTSSYNQLSDWYAPIIVAIGLIGILVLHLVPAYLTGLFIFFAMRKIAGLMPRQLSLLSALWLSLLIIISSMGLLITTPLIWGVNHVHAEVAEKALINTIDLGWKRFLITLSPVFSQYLPASFTHIVDQFADFIGAHWATVGTLSRALFHGILLSIVGTVVGILIAFETSDEYTGFFKKLAVETERAARGFWEVLSAQFFISLINTVLTSIYILFILPSLDIHLPYPTMLLIVTFIAGLLPILGNIISNTVIVLVSFTLSIYVAIASLLFLVFIHTLEYFVNAKIIGMHIQSKAWELLIAFFVCDAAFGLPGIMVAPFFYGYYKLLMKERGVL
jgi:predicted PurR-regulated permease PerM